MKAVSMMMRVKMAASEKNDGALSVERVERDRMKDEEARRGNEMAMKNGSEPTYHTTESRATRL